ncbi:LTA synthase family protein [Pelagicoccus sp. SDUM812005]|uniref:LTA synthase family protein n=1 Tax=Pelagicoccus sp. SDUM812005 TaxID=3041257 RepID=UPI0028111AB1|nr:LTA synthase family protein [Pelagicoccus sp. SDUM812005]
MLTHAIVFTDWGLIGERNLSRHVVGEIGFSGYLINELALASKHWLEERSLASQSTAPYRKFLTRVKEANGSITEIQSRKNLIYIQMESVDGLSIDATYQDAPLMPFLHELRNQTCYFENTIDNTSSGRTTDGEFLALTSLPPISGTPVYRNYDLSKVPSLPRILNAHGYYTFSIHGFDGHFWNREASHHALGYSESFFRDDLDDSDTIGWGISDRSILRQAAQKISDSKRPVFAHIILLTNHHPYDHVSESIGHPSGDIAIDHIESLRYVDKSIQDFFEILERDGALNNSIIAIYSDHDSAIRKEVSDVVSIQSRQVYADSIPLIIYGLETPPRRIRKIAGLQDLPVIALQELGIPVPYSFSGNSLASQRPTLTPNNEFLSLRSGKLTRTRTEFDASTLTRMALLRPDHLKNEER